jgi:hypothetical protein
MIAQVAESPAWSGRRWFAIITSLLAIHVGLIFWFARSQPAATAALVRRPSLMLMAGSALDLAGLSDPTLLPLPNVHGPSGSAWLQVRAMDYQPAPWPGPAGLLKLRTGELGGAIVSIVRSNLQQPLEVADRPPPGLPGTSYYVPPERVSTPASVRVEGELIGRPLLSAFDLKPWPLADTILRPSVVQLVVDEDGRVVFPPVLVPPRSGSDEADARALELARSASFQPLSRSGPRSASLPQRLTTGRLVFDWQTVPPAATNTPAGIR